MAGDRASRRIVLAQCIEQALRNSPGLAAAGYDIAAARSDITKKRGTTLPYVRGKLDAYEVNGSPVTPFAALNVFEPDFGPGSNRTLTTRSAHWGPVADQGVGFTYPLFENGSFLGINNPPVVASARAVLDQEQWTVRLLEQKVVLDAATAFFYAAWYRDELTLQQAQVKLAVKRLQIVTTQAALGLKLPQDVELARSQLEAAQQAEVSARQNSQDADLRLLTELGLPSDHSLALERSEPATPSLPPLRVFLDRVMPTHPALKVQKAKVEIAKQQLLVDQSTRLPTATLNSDFVAAQDLEYFNGGTAHRRPTLFLSYLTVDVPIFDFGQRRAAVDESEQKVLSQKAGVSQVDEDVRTAITVVYNQINDIDKLSASLRSDYIKTGNDLTLSRARRAEGIIDELSLVERESEWLTSKVALESEAVLKRLKFAELQDLSGGNWHWLR